ncbi:MAG: hypothetical protein OEV30_04585 [Ignavibacteria bacterium]|nr:hypothetical protein [Ignavibacteria bacterium]
MKKALMVYLSSYLIGGGLGFAFLPEFTQKLFLSNVLYDEPMVRFAGVMMTLLGSLIGYLVYKGTLIAYRFSIVARTFVVGFIVWVYWMYDNPMFLVLLGVVLIGLLPSYFLLWRDRRG